MKKKTNVFRPSRHMLMLRLNNEICDKSDYHNDLYGFPKKNVFVNVWKTSLKAFWPAGSLVRFKTDLRKN